MTWCIALLTTDSDADAIMGDLHEERLAMAARDGAHVARLWYWRQVLRTIAQLATAPIREAPLTFLIVGLLGFALILPLTWTAFWLAGQIVVRVPMYQYVPATVFWRGVSFMPNLALGALCVAVMKRRAMSAGLAVLAVLVMWIAVGEPLLLVKTLPPGRVPGASEYLARVLPSFLLDGLTLLLATALGRARQRRAAHRAARAVASS